MIQYIEEILGFDCMKDAELIVRGDEQCQHIKDINIMENRDVLRYVQKGQLLLEGFKKIPDDIDDLMLELKNKGARGVITKREKGEDGYIELCSACQNARIHLVKMGKGQSYSGILQSIIKKMDICRMRRPNYYITCHDTFMKIALGGKGVDEIIKALSDMIGKPVLVYDTAGTVLACDALLGTAGKKIERESVSEKISGENLVYYRQTLTFDKKEHVGVGLPFKALGKVHGTLFICLPAGTELNEYEWIAAENAVNVLNLEMTKQVAVSEIEQRFKNDLLSDLLTGNIQSESVILRRANALGWDILKPHVAVVFKLDMGENKTKDDEASVMRTVSGALERAMKSIFLQDCSIIGSVGDTFNVLWPYDAKKSYGRNTERIKEVFDGIYEGIKESCGLKGYSGGIGGECEDIFTIAKSYDEAISAMKYSGLISSDGGLCDINSLGIYRLISKIGNREELMEFIPAGLKKLLEYDSVSKNVLVHTLDTYLGCDCNLGKAAKLLFVHYKTLVYRISRIKEIMDVDSLEGDTRLELQLALKILKMTSLNQEEE